MSISKRLKTIISLVSDGYTVADIGTDHGYVPIALLSEGNSPHAFAVDISPGSLNKAVLNAQKAGIPEGKLEFRLADGLSALEPGEADCIIISGIGGILMTGILKAHMEVVLSARELILSPHRDDALVRNFVKEAGFNIVYDELVNDKKKDYHIIKAVR